MSSINLLPLIWPKLFASCFQSTSYLKYYMLAAGTSNCDFVHSIWGLYIDSIRYLNPLQQAVIIVGLQLLALIASFLLPGSISSF